MTAKKLFAVTSPLGYRVVLTRNRWREIIRYKHPAMSGREAELRECVEQPDTIRESLKDSDIHLYYKQQEKGYLCAVVGRDESRIGFIVTTYFTEKIKQGPELWIR